MQIKFIISLSLSLALFCMSNAQPLLNFENNQTLSWNDAIEYYRVLDINFEEAKLVEAGYTDSGKPLHLFLISGNKRFDPEQVQQDEKVVVLINNGIHPGEPCGIDASALLAKEILENPSEFKSILDRTLIAIIPVLNVGGALNTSRFHRANQNGPEIHGFRGNAINMDLNRDLIKLDTRNAKSFVKIFQKWDPDILIDTHTSNGADYPYVLTLINTQRNKLASPLSEFMWDTMLPSLYDKMKTGPYEMIPYVMAYKYPDPKNGIVSFMDYPRYTTGYASLFQTIGFTTEAHMFKSFKDRVMASYYFIHSVLRFASANTSSIQELRSKARLNAMKKEKFVLRWELDTSISKPLNFEGYTLEYRQSDLSGLPNYSYNRQKKWEKEIPWYTDYKPVKQISIPDYYIVPQAWKEVIERLKINNVETVELEQDTCLFTEYYYIDDYESYSSPYNGHYKHYNTSLIKEKGQLRFMKGDLLIPVRQKAIEYIVQTLEPEGEDSFFNWNFFDAILSRKEYFSPYVFESIAKELLKKDSSLSRDFYNKRAEEENFRNNHYAQLRFIYERSPWSEETYKRYPIARYFEN